MKRIISNMNANGPWRRPPALLVVAALFMLGGLLAGGAGPAFAQFDQGFEQNTDNWDPDGSAAVTRVPSGDPSVTYNSGTTSPYASGISAAPAASFSAFFGRVRPSAISTGTCTIDTSGPGSASSLLCFGPFTDFGLKPAFLVAGAFPDAGYTTQLDIYLDVTYANSHPDCGSVSYNGTQFNIPCLPNQPGAPNGACTTDPNGTACEGSRFNWTVGLNDPSGNFHRDYVFQVGTAPDPTGVFPSAACPSGYIINAQYNSFRSGGNPYQGYEAKCLATSGWYTFKQVFSNDNGFLHVDWSILPSGGNTPATCKDTTGTDVPCTWGRTQTFDPIDEIGCPRYGWLANEEINDLPIDNTKLDIVGCGLVSQGQITPTGTTCQQYANGEATTLDLLLYTEKNGLINSVSPGVFFYYAKVDGSGTVTITETVPTGASPIDIQKLQAVVYSANCTKLKLLDVTDGGATGTLPATGGPFIIGVKYDSSSLKGTSVPNPSPATYTFNTKLNGITQNDSASIELMKK